MPEPLLPTYLHHDLTEAAAVNEDEIVKVLGEVLKKLVPVEWDTLKAVCTHLGKVIEKIFSSSLLILIIGKSLENYTLQLAKSDLKFFSLLYSLDFDFIIE